MRRRVALLSGLALFAPSVADASAPPAAASVGDGEVAAAREGLADWLAANKPSSPSTSTDVPGCPVIDEVVLEEALSSVGLDADLGDWGSEIEWDEYQDIDPDLMGVICGGDTDGDSHDSSYGLAAGVVAVDAGTDERAVDVLTGLGLGALDVADAADVPALGTDTGEVTSGCIDDGGLHACLAFWSVDGLILGTTLWSDAQELPPEAAVEVLGAVLPTMLDTLAGQQGAATSPSGSEPAADLASDGTPVGDARAGLAAVLAATPDTPDAAPLETCALAHADAVDAALEVAGVDAPLGDWGQWIGPIAPDRFVERGVVCEGAHVGVTGEPSFPELSASLAAVDFGDPETLDEYLVDHLGVAADEEAMPTPGAGGSTTGRCAQRDLVDDCYEVWTDGSGFAVMLHVQDRTFFDRPTASAVLNELVPGVLASLGAGPVADDGSLGTIGDEAVDAASAGLSLVAAAPDTGDDPCRALGRADLDAALADTGVAVAVAVDEWTGAPAADRPGFPEASYVCTSVPDAGGDGLTLVASDFATPGDAGDFVASLALTDGGTADDLDPTASTHGSCVTVSGAEFCVELWQRGTMVVGVTLSGPADEIGRGDSAAVLQAVVPGVIETLAAVTPG